MALNFKELNIEDIISWCKANNQIEWLKATSAKQTEYKVYPTKKVADINEDGTPKLKKNGSPKYKNVADKSQPYTIKKHPITFVELKMEFVEKFMPEIAPKAKEKKPSFHDTIANL